MSNVEQSIEVEVPVRTAYNQWTQFETFPHFMDDVERIEQVDDTIVRWHVKMAGVERTFDTKVTEQTPDQRVAWTTFPDAETKHAGVVTFHRVDENQTRVTLQMDVEPTGVAEKVGDALGLMERNIKRDLESFKDFIEDRGTESGAWRGAVDQDPTS